MTVSRAQIEIAARDSTGPAFASVGSRFRGLQGDIDGLASRISSMQGAFAAALAVSAAGGIVASIAEGIDAVGDLADATGASVENVGRLDAAVRRTGGSFEDASALLLKFNQALANARPGSDIEGVFKGIGLSVDELRRQDPVEALLATAAAFDTFGNNGELARQRTEILGKSVGKLAPVFKDLVAQGVAFNGVTRDQANAADDFSKALATVQAQALEVARGAVGDLLPVLSEVLKAFQGTDAEAQALAGSSGLLRTAFETLAVLGANVAFVFNGTRRDVGAMAAQLVALGNLDIAGFDAISAAVKEDAQRARDELDAFERRIFQAGRAPSASYSNEGRNYGGKPRLVAPLESRAVAAQVSEFEKYIQRLGQAQIATLDLSAEEQARIDIVTGQLGKLTAAQEEQVLSLARGLDLLRKGDDFRGPEIPADVLAARQAQAKAIDQLIASSAGARFEALTQTQQALSEQFRNGQITALDYSRATESLGKAFDDLEPKIKAVEEASNAFAEQAARNIQDALGDTLLASMTGKFDSIGDLWKDLIKRMVAQAAAAKLSETLFGVDYGKGGSGFGGLLGSLFSSFAGSGGGGGGQFDGYRANGGPVTSGRAYMVGERGPELFVPRTSGTVLPNGAAPAASQVVQINVAGDVSERNIKLIQRAIATERARSLRAI